MLGHRASDITAALTLPGRARTIVNEQHDQGQATSLRRGLEVLGPEVTHALIVLGDQPELGCEMVDRIAGEAGAAPVVRARFGDAPGHPVLVARAEWETWKGLSGDRGARSLMEGHPEKVVEVTLGAVPLADIDTEDGYAALAARWGKRS